MLLLLVGVHSFLWQVVSAVDGMVAQLNASCISCGSGIKERIAEGEEEEDRNVSYLFVQCEYLFTSNAEDIFGSPLFPPCCMQ